MSNNPIGKIELNQEEAKLVRWCLQVGYGVLLVGRFSDMGEADEETRAKMVSIMGEDQEKLKEVGERIERAFPFLDGKDCN
jgi:hypothetical protein